MSSDSAKTAGKPTVMFRYSAGTKSAPYIVGDAICASTLVVCLTLVVVGYMVWDWKCKKWSSDRRKPTKSDHRPKGVTEYYSYSEG